MKVLRVLILVSVLGPLSLRAADANSELPALMHYFYGTLQQLRPYMASLDEFRDPKNKTAVLSLLKDLETHSTNSEPKEIQQSPGFDVTFPLLSRHIRDVTGLYNHGIYEMAWQRLNATTSLCTACHTRLPEQTKSKSFEWAKLGENIQVTHTLQDAEFFFVAHKYNLALEIFNREIAKHKDPNSVGDLQRLFERKITFFARVDRDPKAAIQSLKADLANKNIPVQIRSNVQTWIKSFESWQAEKNDPSKMSDKDFLTYAQKIVSSQTAGRAISLGDAYTISLLRTSGLIYERVYRHRDSKIVPGLLLNLAKIERELSPIRYYALGDVYLKECIMQYPKSAAGKQCFQDYSLSMSQRFGPGLPEYIKDSLETLRKMTE